MTTGAGFSAESEYLSVAMSLFVSSINSGSNGNCYYIGNENEAVLVDGGISCRETEKRFRRLGLTLKKVKAIFVSHEHGDHTHGVPALSRKHKIPVYVTDTTFSHSGLELRTDLMFGFRAYEPVTIGSLSVVAFPKHHDAVDPHSFVVSSGTVKVGIFTDLGFPCEHVVSQFRQCTAAFLESNYDESMLAAGTYPYPLKQRIRSNRGHLSNDQALDLFVRHRPVFMSHLFLSHLSRENNSPAVVKRLFAPVAGRTEIVIAGRERETKIFHIRHVRRPNTAPTPFSTPVQLSLF